MKITVDVDCTPLEARQFMGLPDVEPMQKAAMAEVEKRMMAELERFSPETLFKAWLPIAGMNADWLQEFFKRASPKDLHIFIIPLPHFIPTLKILLSTYFYYLY